MNLVQSLHFSRLQELKYDYGSCQLDLPDSIASRVRGLAAKIPDKDLAEEGREPDPHVTVKFGLKRTPKNLPDLLRNENPIRVVLGRTDCFSSYESGAEHDVVILRVVSTDLSRLNRLVAGNEDTVETHGQYKPHVTLAYVKKGLGRKYAGDEALAGVRVVFRELTCSDRYGRKARLPLGKGRL
jgi:2'-5' RNA ligase